MNNTSAKAYRVRISGRVTGVGFRWSALDEARRLPGLLGWIRNVDHGEVEALVAGSPGEVAAMLGWLHHGPPGAAVLDCQVTGETAPHGLSRFQVK